MGLGAETHSHDAGLAVAYGKMAGGNEHGENWLKGGGGSDGREQRGRVLKKLGEGGALA